MTSPHAYVVAWGNHTPHGRSLKKKTVTAEKKKGAGRGLIPCPAGGRAGRAAAQPARPAQRKESRNMSANLNRIPLVMFFGLTTDEDKAVRAAAAREGISPAVYMYRLVLTEPGRFIVPLGSPAREAGAASSDCGVPQSESAPQ